MLGRPISAKPEGSAVVKQPLTYTRGPGGVICSEKFRTCPPLIIRTEPGSVSGNSLDADKRID